MIKNYKFIKGNAWVGILLLLVFLTTLGLALITEVVATIVASKRSGQIITAQALCDAGIEKAIWKLNETGGGYIGEQDIFFETGTLDIDITNIDNENKSVLATAYIPSKTNTKVTRKIKAKVSALFNETSASFHYGVQVGGLGVTMSNNAKILGNLYSDGVVIGGNGSEITGDAIVSGSSGTITGSGSGQQITVGHNAKAHNIIYSVIRNDAYYASLQGSTVGGVSYPGSPDPPSVGMPIGQTTIDQWESWAQAGGTINGNYTITGDASLGPIKVDGDLLIDTGTGHSLTINGVIWVTGNLTIKTDSTIKLSPSYGGNSGMILADSPNDKTNKGKIVVNNNVVVQGSGNPKSYIMMIATNTGTEFTSPAINAGNNSDAVVYYAPTGMIEVSQNALMRAISGGGLHLSNGAQVQYDSGLANSNFSGGPGGSWQLTEWQIVH